MADLVGVDASPLIVLAKIGRLELLRAAGSQIVTTRSVMAEVATGGPSDPTHGSIKSLPWLEEVDDPALPTELQAAHLGPGESSLVAWGLIHPGCELILDDLDARNFARRHKLLVRGTLGVVLLAKQRGVILAVRPILEGLRDVGLYVSDPLFDAVLDAAGEQKTIRP